MRQANKIIYTQIPVSSTNKVSYGCIRDLGFNPCLHQKLIGVLMIRNCYSYDQNEVYEKAKTKKHKNSKLSLIVSFDT